MEFYEDSFREEYFGEIVFSHIGGKKILTALLFSIRQSFEAVFDATITILKPIADLVLTITGDNGSEFAYHEKISNELKTDFYFAHPYSSWERGLNENTIGLVRQYFKKGLTLMMYRMKN